MERSTQVTGVILAGGRSRRMGRDKALLPFGPGLLIERVIEVVQQVTADVILITNTPNRTGAWACRCSLTSSPRPARWAASTPGSSPPRRHTASVSPATCPS